MLLVNGFNKKIKSFRSNDATEKLKCNALMMTLIFSLFKGIYSKRKYSDSVVFEFDTLDELRAFDTTYEEDTRSQILKQVAASLSCGEKDIRDVFAFKDDTNEAAGFTFRVGEAQYQYSYKEKNLRRI